MVRPPACASLRLQHRPGRVSDRTRFFGCVIRYRVPRFRLPAPETARDGRSPPFSRAKANSAPHAVRVAWQLESATAACTASRTHECQGERFRINT